MSLGENVKKLVKEIAARYKYVRGKKGVLENPHQDLKQWQPDGAWGKTGRVAGLAGIDLTWFLFCLMKYTAKDTRNALNTVFLNNIVIDKLEERNRKKKIKTDDSNFKKFFKNLQKSHPRAAATLQLWMVYTLMTMGILGGKVAYDNKDYIKEKYIEWTQEDEEQDVEIKKEMEEARQNTFAEYREKLQPITPWLIAQLIAAEGVKMENGMHIPYKDSKGIWTIGFGSTYLKDGTHVTKKTPPITTEEAYDLALWHIEEHETFFYLYCYSIADQNLTVRNTGEAFGLSSIVYNSGTKFIEEPADINHRERFCLLREEYDKYGAAIPDSVVAELFRKYPIVNKAGFGKAWMDSHNPQDMADAIGGYMKDGGGMHWRRWLEAGLFTGDIDPKDLLECPIGGMYEFYVYMGGKKKGKYALWKQTKDGITPIKSTYTDFKNWIRQPQNLNAKTGKLTPIMRSKVKDFIPKEILKECKKGKCEIGAVVQKRKSAKKIEKQTYVIGYEERYKMAMNHYKNGNYVEAIQELEILSGENPNNALLHNNLALMYNKTNNYDKAIEHVRIILHEIGDKSQYAAAQYNAGVAYENLGELEKALKNYKLALTNGNVEAREAIKRVQQKMSKKKSKTVAFDKGILKIKAKQSKQGNIIYPFDNEHRV